MGVLRDLEERLGRWTDRLTARWLGGRPTPRRLAASLSEALRTGPALDGRAALLNAYTVYLCPDDLARLGETDGLRHELVAAMRSEAEARRLGWLGRPRVRLQADPEATAGTVRIEAAAEPGAGRMALLPVAGGAGFELDAQAVIGRDAECGVRLDGEGVSRRHARLEPMVDRWRVTDLGSTNGTLVNGVRISAAALAEGDELRCGDVRLRVREI